MKNTFEGLPPLDKKDYKPLYAQLTDALAAYIKNKNLKPGDPLPSENDLIRFYKVSRMTIRIAFQRLATEGLVAKIQGKGAFVDEPKVTGFIQGVRSLEENLAEQGITVSTVFLEAKVRNNPTQFWLKELSLPPGSKVMRVYRLKRLGQTILGIEKRFFPLDIAEKFKATEIRQRPLLDLLNSHPDIKVHRIVYRTRSELLLERYAEILKVPPGSPVLVQVGTYYNKEDRPVMTGSMIFLANRMEFRYEFQRQNNCWTKRQVLQNPKKGRKDDTD